MVTLYRAAYQNFIRASAFEGNSNEVKPTVYADGSTLENGTEYSEIDTGKVYRFDAEHKVWYEGSSN